MMPTEENRADARRDVLALASAVLRDDKAGALAVRANANEVALLPVAIGMLFEVLDEHGIDPAEWVTRKQAEARG